MPPMNTLLWGYGPPFMPSIQSAPSVDYSSIPVTINPVVNTGQASLPAEAADKKLSTLTIEGLFEVFSKVEGLSTTLPSYKDRFLENNINGKVLLHCDLDDLKKVLNMNFGDWELFRVLVLGLRERELDDDYAIKNVRFASTTDGHHQLGGGAGGGEDVPDDTAEGSSLTSTVTGRSYAGGQVGHRPPTAVTKIVKSATVQCENLLSRTYLPSRYVTWI
nr:kinase D-interacting substrate of 220 kDa B-like isoform X1 [Cherax quadricarinatus]